MSENNKNSYKEEGFVIPPSKMLKIECILAYIYIFWLVGLLSKNKSKELRFHVNQGIILSIFSFSSFILIQFLSGVLFFIAHILTCVSALLQITWLVLTVTYTILGIKNVLKEETTPLPFIGELFNILK